MADRANVVEWGAAPGDADRAEERGEATATAFCESGARDIFREIAKERHSRWGCPRCGALAARRRRVGPPQSASTIHGGLNTSESWQNLAAGAVSTSVGLSIVKCTDDTLGTEEGHPGRQPIATSRARARSARTSRRSISPRKRAAEAARTTSSRGRPARH